MGQAATALDLGGPGPVEVLAVIDSLGVDACGNLYLTEFQTRSLYGVPAGGGAAVLLSSWGAADQQDQYGHGFAWGAGVGGWSETSIYLAQPYADNGVIELELGIESKPMPFP